MTDTVLLRARRFIPALVGVSVLLTTGCETVEPWQRQYLAKPEMAWASDPQEAQLLDQIYFSKEGSSGGGKSSGGGCGCN